MAPSRAELPASFDDLHGGIVLHDEETGAILDLNSRAEQLYGYSSARLRADGIGLITPPSTKFTEQEASERIQSAAKGEAAEFEWQIQRASGELRWVRVQLSRTEIGGGAYVLAEVEDVSEYRTRERRLRLLSRIVRHNLRNKTTVLRGHASRVRDAIEHDRLDDELETILQITDEVGTLSASVKQLEQIAEPSATERSATDLKSIASSCVDAARDEYPHAELSVGGAADVVVIADEGLTYALDHAIENAIEHNDQDDPRVDVTVLDADDSNRGHVQVVDNGPSIPDVEVDVLRDSVRKSSTYHGTGVGLWVMQWCVDSLGGTLSFEDGAPRGNVVTISLPKADDTSDQG